LRRRSVSLRLELINSTLQHRLPVGIDATAKSTRRCLGPALRLACVRAADRVCTSPIGSWPVERVVELMVCVRRTLPQVSPLRHPGPAIPVFEVGPVAVVECVRTPRHRVVPRIAEAAALPVTVGERVVAAVGV